LIWKHLQETLCPLRLRLRTDCSGALQESAGQCQGLCREWEGLWEPESATSPKRIHLLSSALHWADWISPEGTRCHLELKQHSLIDQGNTLNYQIFSPVEKSLLCSMLLYWSIWHLFFFWLIFKLQILV
jgi:hypothetical protein